MEEILELYERYMLNALDRLVQHAKSVSKHYNYEEAREALELAERAKEIAGGVYQKLPDVVKWVSEIKEKRAVEKACEALAKIEKEKERLKSLAEEYEQIIQQVVDETEKELKPIVLLDKLGGLVNTAAKPIRAIIHNLYKILYAEQDSIFWKTARKLETEGKIKNDEDYIFNLPKALIKELENEYFKAALERSNIARELYEMMDQKFQKTMLDFMVASEKLQEKVEKDMDKTPWCYGYYDPEENKCNNCPLSNICKQISPFEE